MAMELQTYRIPAMELDIAFDQGDMHTEPKEDSQASKKWVDTFVRCPRQVLVIRSGKSILPSM